MKSDIMLNFEYSARNWGLDLTIKDGGYVCRRTREAYYWYREGIIDGQKWR